jgi:23S rRNA pseudouridine2605 synthase
MRQDQLEKARAARWRQDGNALVTLDDAERWLAETPLCLYLPRRAHLPVPAPSFVEAVAGAADATPNPERLAAAAEMLGRLVASGAVVALSLFGAPAGVAGEQPDFLATPEALPFLYALQPERNPKRAPSTVGSARVSPLAAEAYKTLERDGAQTAIELRERLGREVTEAAVLRALSELWHTMRAVPVPATAGDLDLARGAHWELLAARHRHELIMGSTQAQTTALAMLVSFYLRSAVAATGEEVELFLSPVSSRARIRDVVHGLTATRQLGEFSLGGAAQLYVEGTLPEIAEEVVIAEDAGLEENQPSFVEAAADASPASAPIFKRPASARTARPAFGKPRPAFGDRVRTAASGARGHSASGERPPRREGGYSKPAEGEFGRRSEAARGAGSRSERPASDRPRTSGPRSFAGGSDRQRSGGPRTDRPRSERPPRTNRLTSSGQPRRPGGGFRKAASQAAGARPPLRSSADAPRPRPAGDRPFRKPFAAGADRPFKKPYAERSGAPATDRPFKKPYAPRESGSTGAPFKKAYAARPERATGDRPFKKPYAARGARPDRPAGERAFKKPYAPRGDRPQGDRPFKKPYAPRGERPAGDGPFKKPYAPRPERAEAGGPPRRAYSPRPAGAGGRAPGGAGARPAFSKRPGTAAAGPGRTGAGRPAGAARPGGFAKPGGSARPGGFNKAGGFSKPGGRPSLGKAAGFSKPGFSKPGFSKPGFSKPGAAGKRFSPPRPGGTGGARGPSAGTGRARPSGARSGGPAASRPRSAGGASGAGRPGGFSPPRRKPKAPGAGDEG